MAQNPVVATYWLSSVLAHYAPIRDYDIMWDGEVSILIRTEDEPGKWYTLGGAWSGQEGVYYFE
jgi:hypothetical protein